MVREAVGYCSTQLGHLSYLCSLSAAASPLRRYHYHRLSTSGSFNWIVLSITSHRRTTRRSAGACCNSSRPNPSTPSVRNNEAFAKCFIGTVTFLYGLGSLLTQSFTSSKFGTSLEEHSLSQDFRKREEQWNNAVLIASSS